MSPDAASSGVASSDRVPSDRVPSGAVIPGAVPSDAVSSDGVRSDRAPVDGVRSDRVPVDGAPYDAVVLAGGRGSRLGGVSKPEVRVAGRSLLDHALDAVAGARHVVVVGPDHLARPGLTTVLEDPPFGGPVAGLAAGVAALQRLRRGDAGGPQQPVGPPAPADDVPVLVLACDVPGAAPAVADLLTALAAHPDADGAQLVRDGRAQPVAVHRPAPLRAALAALDEGRGVHGVALRRLLDRLTMVGVDDPAGRSADADTWDDVARLDAALGVTSRAAPPGPPASGPSAPGA